MADIDFAEALCETDDVTTEVPEDTSPAIQSTQDVCAILLEESDTLCILKDDIDGLAAFALLLDKEFRKYKGTKELYHMSKALEAYCDTLEDVIDRVKEAEKALFEMTVSKQHA